MNYTSRVLFLLSFPLLLLANPNYILKKGDTITFDLLGKTYADTKHKFKVDSQGNINIPQTGFVKVSGERYDEVKEVISSYLSNLYENSDADVMLDSSSKPKNYDIKVIKYIDHQTDIVDLSLSAKEVDFWQLLNEAMEKSASLILKNHDLNITKANLTILKSEYYPNLSLRYYNEYYHGFSRNGSANIEGATYPSNSEYRNSLNLNMNYEVYHFGASELKMQMGKMDLDILKSEIEVEKERIAKELLQSYTAALKAQEHIQIKKKMLIVKNILLKNTQRLYNSGFASKTDIARLNIDKLTIEKEILRSHLDMIEAIKNIQIITNIKIDTEVLGLAMIEPIETNIKSFQHTALANNIKLNIDKKIKEIELIKKDYLPTIMANGAYQLYGNDKDRYFDAIEDLERNNWNVAIILKWDIFNGFKTDNSVQIKKLEIEKLAEQYRLEEINFKAQQDKRVLLKQMIDKILKQERIVLGEISIQKDLLTRLQKSGSISIIEVDKVEISRLQRELDFKLDVINQVNEDILSKLII